MAHLTYKVPQVFAEILGALRSNARNYGQKTLVDVVKFGSWVTFHDKNRDVEQFAGGSLNYRPSGGTALLDAIGEAVRGLELQTYPPNTDVSYMVVVLTDGEENQSRNFTPQQITNLITGHQLRGNWTFVCQVPPRQTHVASRFGIPVDNIREWEATEQGLGETMSYTSQGFNNYYLARSAGATKVDNFYAQTDLSNIKVQDLKDKLKDVRSNFSRAVTVPKEMQIKEFVENVMGQPYRVGSAYYQLTKPELVQAGKGLAIMEKGKLSVFSGNAARSMIGLPYNQTAKVTPGNHSNFDVFVQSTSTNRKLVRGTKVLVEK